MTEPGWSGIYRWWWMEIQTSGLSPARKEWTLAPVFLHITNINGNNNNNNNRCLPKIRLNFDLAKVSWCFQLTCFEGILPKGSSFSSGWWGWQAGNAFSFMNKIQPSRSSIVPTYSRSTVFPVNTNVCPHKWWCPRGKLIPNSPLVPMPVGSRSLARKETRTRDPFFT